jgi:hypothetical protein
LWQKSEKEQLVIQQNELIMLLLGVGVLIFIIENRQKLRRVPAAKIMISGFGMILGGWCLTVLEGFIWRDFFNFMEHMCYAASSLLMAFWCWKVFQPKKDAE